MSEPFAVVDPGDDDEGEMPTLDFGGICQMTKGDDDDHAESVADFTKYAAKINAAVTARERKAAAQALREAADSAVQDAEWKGVTEKTYTSHQMAQWLRTLADLAEKGER